MCNDWRKIFTDAVLDKLTSLERREVTYSDISNLTYPKLIGDVLILPISAFGSGQDHSGSKPNGNEEQLLCHHYMGFQGWKLGHAGAPGVPQAGDWGGN
jgi:alpha 1,6-mannosyltransferase